MGKRFLHRGVLVACLLCAGAAAVHAAERRIPFTSYPVTIDAILDEQVWAEALAIELDVEIEPAENSPAPVQTTCLLAHDRTFLYVAFRAADPQPAAIRAHLTDRDRPYRDDYVGLVLDTFNDQRRGFEFFVNPVGVQLDATRNEVGSSSNGKEDFSWDAIWTSAARITADGYQVEMAIPFTSLRFPPSGEPTIWGIEPLRAYPRSRRHILAAHPIVRGDNCPMCRYIKVIGFADVEVGHHLELDPTLVTQRSDARADAADPASRMVRGDVELEPGLSARWGVTPHLTLNAALNPDFSQVEADAAQLDVNTRFALFYPEKRPFFMEGADFFGTPIAALYTRAVADPSWGVKLTGKPGAQAIGAFLARDDQTNILVPGRERSRRASLNEAVTAGVVRYRRDVGRASTLGVLATVREGERYHNRVAGVDGLLLLSATSSVAFQLLASDTAYPDDFARAHGQPMEDMSGQAMHVRLGHDTRSWNVWARGDARSEDFRADLGFVPRVGVREAEIGAQRVWWGQPTDFLSRLTLGIEGTRTQGSHGGLVEEEAQLFLRASGPLQSSLRVELKRGTERYAGDDYDLDSGELFFNIRTSGAFTCSFEAEAGDAIDYEHRRPGRILRLEIGPTLDLGRHLALTFDHTFERLEVDGGALYRANLSQLKAVYQLNVRTFVRAIVQHLDLERAAALYELPSPSERELFAQLLFSYKVNPQTVVFVGYSDLGREEEPLRLRRAARTFFLKLGYAWLV